MVESRYFLIIFEDYVEDYTTINGEQVKILRQVKGKLWVEARSFCDAVTLAVEKHKIEEERIREVKVVGV